MWYTASAVSQWVGAACLVALFVVALRRGEWRLAWLTLFMATFFLRVGFINWGRSHPTSIPAEWAREPALILTHSLVVILLSIVGIAEMIFHARERRT